MKIHSPHLFTLLVLLLRIKSAFSRKKDFEVVYQWKLLDYDWQFPEDRENAIESGAFIPKNNAISGIKLWQDRAFVSVPRLLPGVPSTFNWVSSKVDELGKTVPLNPYPTWDMQEVGNCSALQNVQGMEIDREGRIWVLDVGRRDLLTPTPNNDCRPKLMIFNSSSDTLLFSFVFPEDVASDNSFLNDLALENIDESGRFLAYIADSGTPGGIVVYNSVNDEVWRVEDSKSMNVDPKATKARVGDKVASLIFNLDGIALTPDSEKDRQVFYSPLGSFHLYSIPTKVLKDPKDFSIQENVRDWGNRSSQSDGMMFDNKGDLYYGLLTKDALAVWTHKARRRHKKGKIVEEILAKNTTQLQWIDSFGFDKKGFLWFTSNRLQNVQAMDVKEDEVNYRINRIRVRRKSYMYD